MEILSLRGSLFCWRLRNRFCSWIWKCGICCYHEGNWWTWPSSCLCGTPSRWSSCGRWCPSWWFFVPDQSCSFSIMACSYRSLATKEKKEMVLNYFCHNRYLQHYYIRGISIGTLLDVITQIQCKSCEKYDTIAARCNRMKANAQYCRFGAVSELNVFFYRFSTNFYI